jgi:hypothetical protein
MSCAAVRISDVEIPTTNISLIFNISKEAKGYLAQRNFIKITLTLASLGFTGSMVTPHRETEEVLASGLSG